MECDGTDIDDDDELHAFQGSVFMGLKEGELWSPAATPDPPVPEPAIVATASPSATMEVIPSTCNFENRLRFEKVIAKSLVASFFWNSVYIDT